MCIQLLIIIFTGNVLNYKKYQHMWGKNSLEGVVMLTQFCPPLLVWKNIETEWNLTGLYTQYIRIFFQSPI